MGGSGEYDWDNDVLVQEVLARRWIESHFESSQRGGASSQDAKGGYGKSHYGAAQCPNAHVTRTGSGTAICDIAGASECRESEHIVSNKIGVLAGAK